MKKILYISLIALVVVSGIVLAQVNNRITIENRWKTVEELAEKQLPESALKEVDEILVQAQKEKNTGQIIKALLYKMRFTLDKAPDKAPELIHEFEIFAEKSTDPAEKALLHSMTAELYARHYQNNSWTINRRTQIAGPFERFDYGWTAGLTLQYDGVGLNFYYEKGLHKMGGDYLNVKTAVWTGSLVVSM